jgi:hypothetical protein
MREGGNKKPSAAPSSSLAAAAARMTLTSAPKKTSNIPSTSSSTTKDTKTKTSSNSNGGNSNSNNHNNRQISHNHPRKQFVDPAAKPNKKNASKEQNGGKERGPSSLQNYTGTSSTLNHPTKPKDERGNGTGTTISKVKKIHKPHHSTKKNPPIAPFEISLDSDGDHHGNDGTIPDPRSRQNGRRSQNTSSHDPQHHQRHNSSDGKGINVKVSNRLIGSALGRRIPGNNNHNNNGNTHSQNHAKGHSANEHKRSTRIDNRGAHHHGTGNGSRTQISTGRNSGREKRHESRSWGGGEQHGKNSNAPSAYHGNNGRAWDSRENANQTRSQNNKHHQQGRHDRHDSDSSRHNSARIGTSVPKLEKQAPDEPRLVSKSEVVGPIERTQMSNWADDSDSDSD